MVWRIVGLIAWVISLIALPIWPYSPQWTIYPSGFFFLIGLVSFAVSFFGRRQTPLWSPKKDGLTERKPGERV
jgi:hypothetical protein